MEMEADNVFSYSLGNYFVHCLDFVQKLIHYIPRRLNYGPKKLVLSSLYDVTV